MMPNDTIEGELARVREWAKDQLEHGSDQPWSSFLLDRLHETIGALLAGMAATRAVDARRAGEMPGLRLVASKTDLDAIEDLAKAPSSRARVAEPVS
jgi:hypothetical protein